MDASTATARALRGRMTDAEQRIWAALRDRRLRGFKFRRQYPVGSYVLDFYCPEAALAIEVDGGQHAIQAAADARREQVLASHGIQMLRFWNNDVMSNVEGVLQIILATVAPQPSAQSDPPSPFPLPPRAGGEGLKGVSGANLSLSPASAGERVGVRGRRARSPSPGGRGVESGAP